MSVSIASIYSVGGILGKVWLLWVDVSAFNALPVRYRKLNKGRGLRNLLVGESCQLATTSRPSPAW